MLLGWLSDIVQESEVPLAEGVKEEASEWAVHHHRRRRCHRRRHRRHLRSNSDEAEWAVEEGWD